MVDFIVVIPARYASTRLPGKPLRLIGGQPMIQRVHACAEASGAREVIVATDDQRVRAACVKFDAQALMTATTHGSGSERIAEVVETRGIPAATVIVNLQGDEPLMPPALIGQVAAALAGRPAHAAATACTPIESGEELFDANVVKVVRDHDGDALYFSRAPLPWHREAFTQGQPCLPASAVYRRHIGLYAYRAGSLQHYVRAPVCAIEELERLEQLRILFHGGRIHVADACATPGPGVDTEADLERACAAFAAREAPLPGA